MGEREPERRKVFASASPDARVAESPVGEQRTESVP